MEESLEETNLDVCTAQIGHRFDCLAATLEMPVRTNTTPQAADTHVMCVPCTQVQSSSPPRLHMLQFKDNVYSPQPETGWSGERSRRLGEQTVDAIAAVLGDLR